MLSFLILKILILKDVRRGAHQAEADAISTGIAWRKRVSSEHHHLMSAAMRAVMQHLINSGLNHRLAGVEGFASVLFTWRMVTRPSFTVQLEPMVAQPEFQIGK